MGVQIEYQSVKKSIEYRAVIGKLIQEQIKQEGKKLGDIAIIFTSNKEILRINRTYLNHSYYTDVITFPDIKRDLVSGDIYISLDQVQINSNLFGTLFHDEVTRVIIHGVLHLIGYKDSSEEEKTIMRNREDHYLCRFKEVELIRK